MWDGVCPFSLQVVVEFFEQHCTGSMVSWEGIYPFLCQHVRVCLSLSASLFNGVFLVLLGLCACSPSWNVAWSLCRYVPSCAGAGPLLSFLLLAGWLSLPAASCCFNSRTSWLGAQIGNGSLRLHCWCINTCLLCYLHLSRQLSLASAPAQ